MTIEIMKIFKESFRNVQEHWLEWLKVAYAPVIIWLIGFVFMALVYWSTGQWSYETLVSQLKGQQVLTEQPFIVIFANVVYYIAYFIAIFTIYINGFRYAVLGEGGDHWWTLRLDWRFVKMILYTILISILVGIYVLIAAGIIIGIYFLINSVALSVILGILFTLFGIYLLVRIGLTYLLIAVDQIKPIRVSWNLLKGNVLRLFWLLVLIAIAIFLISLAGAIILGIFGWILSLISLWLVSIPIVLFLIFGFFMWLLSWAVGSKAFALVYKTFTSGKAF
jgi:hypothetical protein